MQPPRASLLCAALLLTQSLFGQSISGRAPGFTLPDSKPVERSNLDYRGRWLIIDFMRTDSGHCKALSKTLEEVKAKYGSKLDVLAIVGAPDNSETVARYIAETNITYPVLFDGGQVTATYVTATTNDPNYDAPHWFAVDPDGKIMAGWAPYSADSKEWVKQLDQLISWCAAGRGCSPLPMEAWVAQSTPAPSSDYLNKAARAGNLKQVQDLIAEGTPVNGRDSLGGTPLHDAAWAGEKDVAAYLISKGAEVNARHTEGGSTPLHYAVLTNHPEVVELLLDHGADLKILYKTKTALHLAAASGYARCATLLIAHGADVNARDETGATPLSEASWTGETEMVRLLVAKGANANDVNPQTGTTPLHAAASRGYREVAKVLIDAGARADVRDKSGATPLYLALQFQRMDVVDLLIRDATGSLPKPQSVDVKAVLRDEVLRGQTNVVSMLLDRMPPLGSTTLLHDAALKGHIDIMELLLSHGADVNSLNAQGATALHDAALAGQRAAADALLKHGANINARDSDSGATPLHQAASWGRRSVVELLLARHADPGIKDKNGRTALDLAVANGQQEVAEVLKRTP
jgi:ankyrin repeat protein/peroxiredoxin